MRGDAELSLLFVDEAAIAELNQRFMGEDGPDRRARRSRSTRTPIEGGRWPDSGGTGPGRPPPEPDRAAAAARRRRRLPGGRRSATRPTHAGTYDDELALLVVHGILHLLGHGPRRRRRGRRRCSARERELLERVPPRPIDEQRRRSLRSSLIVVVARRSPPFFADGRDRAHPHEPGQGAWRWPRRAGAGADSLAAAASSTPSGSSTRCCCSCCCLPPRASPTLVGVARRAALRRPAASSSPSSSNVVVIFVLAEAAPKTWAVQHTERAALLVGAARVRARRASRRCASSPAALIGAGQRDPARARA